MSKYIPKSNKYLIIPVSPQAPDANWTMGMLKQGLPAAERAKRLLIIFEDDAVVTTDTVAALQSALPKLDPSFDILALDSAGSFCSLSCRLDWVMRMLGLHTPGSLPRLIRARISFSRTTGVVLSYKGAVQLFRYLPITRVSDLWERDLGSQDRSQRLQGWFPTDIYVIHSYWSPERRHIAPALCDWFKREGGQLANVPCTLFPGFWARGATRDQILDLVARRIVAPETHAKPQGPLTQLLYRLGFSAAAPLFDDEEKVINLSYLGTAASHLLAVQNWTMEMVKQGVPPAERTNRHLLLFEDDAVVTPETVTALQGVLQDLDPCYDVVGLDSTDNFCTFSSFTTALLDTFLLRKSPSSRLVPARMSYSRNTGLVMSYKGAMNLLSGLPVTREIDLWFRDLMTDQVLKIFVICPRIVGPIGLETVQ
ncbi:hypothetical protein VOLCADRAFT_107575 [Volvox carteri f. nagariensis]|uniref:Uncharacterized protein n=1 Tax=Volvox carteri f. nagariensis TaxID=3068 RepID=D8UF11_VOLCA|nr:uncharacterized protein VOLCADRAFT_107575 [Volvox carteri f. nagariensis]EFJ41689.1 hypothetical protein VOLCADRAFT_107575 [Volvox carteri f. nagariensis]|eukprot:XP_002957191.1 hypothetical protein VOLCADRAFT_107575 [Volvox carteri f. nagariensis]